jgi:hypothetical protein
MEGTNMKTTKVDTWLPIFSGFYGTIWETENDGHKLASVLDFILKHDEGGDDSSLEYRIYENLHGNGVYLTAANYSDLMEKEVA